MPVTVGLTVAGESAPIDKLAVNTIRTLCMDAVQAANSGHPGSPMDMAPDGLRAVAAIPAIRPGRSDLAQSRPFRALGRTRVDAALFAAASDRREGGQPQVRVLGRIVRAARGDQAIPAARQQDVPVIPSIAGRAASRRRPVRSARDWPTASAWRSPSRWLAARYNTPGLTMFDFNVYALCGDGCMMEGISSEAASLAAHWKLSNLCWIYDSNRITIEGHTALAFTEDVATRFMGYGWNVTRVGDANDLAMLERAFKVFQDTQDRPTLIIVDSHIAWGAPNKQDTSAAHGEPLGEEEIRLTKRNYGWPEDAKFLVPDGVYEHFHDGIGKRGKELRDAWFKQFDEYKKKSPDLADELHANAAAANCPRAGTKSCRHSPPIPKAWARANRRARCSTPSPKTCRG